MSDIIKDGGSAFPGVPDLWQTGPDGARRLSSAWGVEGSPGMSLRDYFAASALQSLIHTGVEGTVKDAANRLGIEAKDYKFQIHWPMLCAMDAYAFADAMIAERNKH